jgi:hypothetical protein
MTACDFLDCQACLQVARYRCDGCGAIGCVNDDCTGKGETRVCECEQEPAFVKREVA